MAENAGARFYEGLRVTADHLRHMQDRLWEAVGDLRLALGRGRIAWGLRAEMDGTTVRVHPGVAFSPEGVRLSVDTEATLALPDGDGPFLVRLMPVNEDRASLQMGGLATYVTLRADPVVIPEDSAPEAPEALDIGRIANVPVTEDATETGLAVVQDPTLFVAAGHHGHSGTFVQDAAGRWSYDGPRLPELEVLADQIIGIDAALAELNTRFGPLEDLPARLSDLEEDAARHADLDALAAQIAELQPLVAILAELQALAEIEGALQTLAALLPDVERIPEMLTRLGDLETALDTARAAINDLADRVRTLETAGGGDGTNDGTGIDPDWPQVLEINWPHGAILPLDNAFEMLSELMVQLSMPLHRDSIDPAGMAVQVWFEPMTTDARNGPTAQTIFSLPGKGGGDGDRIFWATTTNFDALAEIMRTGGRLMLRLHCGALMAEDGRAYSASLQNVTGAKSLPVPGGVLESWFFVQEG